MNQHTPDRHPDRRYTSDPEQRTQTLFIRLDPLPALMLRRLAASEGRLPEEMARQLLERALGMEATDV